MNYSVKECFHIAPAYFVVSPLIWTKLECVLCSDTLWCSWGVSMSKSNLQHPKPPQKGNEDLRNENASTKEESSSIFLGSLTDSMMKWRAQLFTLLSAEHTDRLSICADLHLHTVASSLKTPWNAACANLKHLFQTNKQTNSIWQIITKWSRIMNSMDVRFHVYSYAFSYTEH